MANQSQPPALNGKYQVTGPILRKAREKLGLSQTAAARILGVSSQSMSNWEAGVSKPWVAHHEKLQGLIDASEKAERLRSKSTAEQIAQWRPIEVNDEPELELEPEVEEREPAQQYIAKRHTRHDLRFMGWKLATGEGQSANGADCVATLYETQRGTFVVEIRYVISGRCFSTFGERDYLLEKTPMEWVANLIRENTEVKYVDLD
jgi:transcriptional regulator with XRE-family HTH domain